MHSFLDLPKRTIRNNSNKIILFNQTSKDNKNIYRDVAGYDVIYDELKEFCRKSWEDEYDHLCFDRSKKKDRGRYCICNESKNTYIECTPETKPFRLTLMLYSIKNRVDLEKLEELASLQNQVEELRLQDILGKQNFHENIKKLYEALTDTVKDTARDITKNITEIFFKNNNALENINNKLLEIMNDRGILASYLLSHLSKITNPEHTSQPKRVKDPSSNRVNDLLIIETIPVTVYYNLLIFRDTDENFELQGDLLKMITNKNNDVDLANSQDRELMYEFAKETYFGERAL